MKKKTRYVKHQKPTIDGIEDNYQTYIGKLNRRKQAFKIMSTRYSKVVVTDDKRLIFNATGERDSQTLKLINMVRSDVKKYIENNDIEQYNSADVAWYYYNDVYGNLKLKGDVLKIDLTAAYWTHAINIGVISDKTEAYFEAADLDKKEKKYLRLKALGSLATVKRVSEWKDGKEVSRDEKIDIANRNVYLKICDYVAETLKEITVLYGIYSYWDCVFVQDDDNAAFKLEQIEHFFNVKGFKFTVEKDSYEIVKSRLNPYIKTTKVDFYPIKADDIIY